MVDQKETNDWNSVHFVGGSGQVPIPMPVVKCQYISFLKIQMISGQIKVIERRPKETEAWNFVASVIVNQHRETSGAALQSKK